MLHVRSSDAPLFPLTHFETLGSFQRFLNGWKCDRRCKVLPRIICLDGFSFSVQASDFHGCHPQSLIGPYLTVEVAGLSEEVDVLLPFMVAEPVDPTEGIYRYVPVETVVDLINYHGGRML
ncbi:hypothetical protein D2T29_12185 [Sinirhodobacter populi]|uniref:Uncharacterized protein n=1 Tax=Paenirhodobacter populi TaxID=2306993 RepID=A0A443KCF9_9RHOB|nr:hypothetical protein [Sinirhodobacter populi]RWR30425.1 hypothetical protein D2T29_12185 [Sinirhodobacter populi]